MTRTLRTSQSARVPRQRSGSRPPSVLLVLTPDEPLTSVATFAARAAAGRDVPLGVVMLTEGRHVRAGCMAALDTTLQLVRTAAPRAMVRVDALDLRSARNLADALDVHDLVVASPDTWGMLTDHAADTAADATVHLVGQALRD